MKKTYIFVIFFIILVSILTYLSYISTNKTLYENISKILFKKESAVEVAFIGDIFFDRYIREVAEDNGYNFILNDVSNYLNKFDLVIGNLEGPVTNYPSQTNTNMYTFTFSEKVPVTLFKSNIKVVSLDNNHILNFGNSGVSQTVQNLRENEMEYFGNPNDRKVLYKEIEGIKLAFISYNQFLPDKEKTISLIKEAKNKASWIIIYTHWGDEYEIHPNNFQKNLAHEFIDTGADLIIGSHPHVIQDKEKYKGKWIYYSLGNFAFDQYFSKDVRCGLLVSFELDKEKILKIKERNIYLEENGQTVFKEC